MSTTKSLFTLQHYHSSDSQVAKGNNDVSSLCFLPKPSQSSFQESSNDGDSGHNKNDIESDDDSCSSDSDSEEELQFKSRQIMTSPQHQLQINHTYHHPPYKSTQISSARDTHASLSFSHTLLASSHASGYAYLWDLTSRRVIHTLEDEVSSKGPGLALGRVDIGNYETKTDGLLFHQRRNEEGSISIHDPNANYSIVRRMECYSRTFCHATASSNQSGQFNPIGDLLLSPSRHAAFAQLWDLRMEKSAGVIHGAKLDGSDVSDWNQEGMLMSLDLCHDGSKCFVGCGMESGNVFLHDLRMLRDARMDLDHNHCISGGNRNSDSFQMRDFITRKDVIETEMCSVSLGKDPILCLDMCLSQDKSEKPNKSADKIKTSQISQSVVLIAGKAADAMELLDLPEEERGTVAVIKATSRVNDRGNHENTEKRMSARVRAKVETCKISNELSREGKPGVGVCKFRPDGSMFAVGGWDKRVRIYSRTSAKLLAVLKGSNSSVTALDWRKIEGTLDDDHVIAAGCSNGKIDIWRPTFHEIISSP